MNFGIKTREETRIKRKLLKQDQEQQSAYNREMYNVALIHLILLFFLVSKHYKFLHISTFFWEIVNRIF